MNSKVIENSRFPLIFFVLMMHSYKITPPSFGKEWSYYPYVVYLFSNELPRFAVPAFFFISGFLFFYNSKFDYLSYKVKIGRRLRTLIIPYILWNLMPVGVNCLLIIKNVFYNGSDIIQLANYLGSINVLSLFWDSTQWLGHLGYPENLPLWYLRDLIVICFLTPLIYWLVKYVGWLYVLLLTLLYIGGGLPSVGVFKTSGIFFFSLGAFLSVKGLNVYTSDKRILWLVIPYVVLTFLGCYAYGATVPFISHLRCLQVLVSLLLFFYFCYKFIEKRFEISTILTSASFFIYCSHWVLITPSVKQIIYMIGNQQSEFVLCVDYLVTPFAITATCLALYITMLRFAPRLLAVLTGNRTFSKQ